ncbi:hypothetical protein C8J57DRAFT_1470762 [Mycena rebaudengoi]|nr:hypothetical protein C8J57DRAFT_1470762 [Mycena rebaudengoi]
MYKNGKSYMGVDQVIRTSMRRDGSGVTSGADGRRSGGVSDRPSSSNQPPRPQKEVKLDPELAAIAKTDSLFYTDDSDIEEGSVSSFHGITGHLSGGALPLLPALRSLEFRVAELAVSRVNGAVRQLRPRHPAHGPTLVDLDLERLAFDLDALVSPALATPMIDIMKACGNRERWSGSGITPNPWKRHKTN